jgi:hypothetical protein
MSPRETDKLYHSDTESTIGTSDHSSHTSNTSKKSVSFGVIQVREYNRVLGDNPDVLFGPPISIGWDYVQKDALPMDEYETTKPQRKGALRMSSVTRRNMLLNVFEVPADEIRAVEREVKKIQKQRSQTNKQGTAGRAVESAMQSAKRRLRRTFSSEHILKSFALTSGGMIPMNV